MMDGKVLIELPVWCKPVGSLLGCGECFLELFVIGDAHGTADLW